MTVEVRQRTAVEEWQAEREAFFAEHRRIIGGSDAAAILGLSRWRTAVDVWAEKVGLTPDRAEMTMRQFIGLRLEPLIAEMAGARLGRTFRRRHGLIVSRTYPFIGGHVDYVGLEVKTSYSAEGWGEDGAIVVPGDRDSWDAVPIDYLLQVQHYLYVTGWPLMTIAVLIGHDDFRTFDVRPIPDLITNLVAEEVGFWEEYVATGAPPPLDASEGSKAYLRAKFPRATGPLRTATPEESLLIEDIRRETTALAAMEDRRETLRTRLKAQIGADLGLAAPGVTAIHANIAVKPAVNWEGIARAYRAILAKRKVRVPRTLDAIESLHTAPASSHRRLDIRYSRRDG